MRLGQRVELLADVTVSDISQRYRMNGVLGSGAQATVYAGVSKKSQKKVAIKVIKKNGDMNDDESMATELDILKMVHHR